MQQVRMSDDTLEFCKDALIRQIEATYDEPGICDRGCRNELAFLTACARDLGVDFVLVVSKHVTVSEQQRMQAAIAAEDTHSADVVTGDSQM